MDSLPESGQPANYEFRVRGRISLQNSVWFEGMQITFEADNTPPQTLIWGNVEDQAALHGLISRIRDLGLTLLSVERIE